MSKISTHFDIKFRLIKITPSFFFILTLLLLSYTQATSATVSIANILSHENAYNFNKRVYRFLAPSVTTGAATGIVSDGATLNGTVNANGDLTTVAFEYGTDTNYGNTVAAAQSPVTGSTNTAVSASISGLSAYTIYHYRVTGTNASGTTYGSDMTFTTSVIAPTVSTDAASSVTSSGATLNGTVNANNSSTTVTFEYGLTTAYGTTVTAAQSPVTGSTNTAVSASLSGLSANTTYHYRVTGTNASGTNNGSDMTFITSVIAPTVSTDAASSVTSSGATLNGTVNANNSSTTVTFEYGLTTAYGTTVTADQSPVTGSTNTAVSKSITGLSQNTTYHYRVVGQNSGGTTNGADATFLTEFAAPTTQAASISFSNVGAATLKVSWTSGNGTSRAAFIKEAESGSAVPDNDTTYTANPKFGSGSQISTTGWYCVYNGTGSNVTVESLTPGKTYRTSVTEYNGTPGREQYITTTAAGNPANEMPKIIMINEIDADTEGIDSLEFIELYDGGIGNVSLTGLVLVTFNGSDDKAYNLGGHSSGIDLDGKSTDAEGYFLLGNSAVPGIDTTFNYNSLQNGADAVALYLGDGTDFRNDSLITTDNLIDAIVYDTDDADDAALLILLNGGEPQVNEDSRNQKVNHSIQRLPNGTGGLRNTSTYIADWPTPGADNRGAPDMYVEGNGNAIPDGSTTPAITNDTDFGSADVFDSKTNTFTIENNGLGALSISGTSPYVTISGSNADQFSVTKAPSNSIAASGTSTFDIKFAPTSMGVMTATVTIINDDPVKGIYNFQLGGTGLNIPPQLSNIEAAALEYIENTGGVNISNTIILTDLSDINIESAAIAITGNYIDGEDRLLFANSANITGIWDPGNGTLTLTGSSSVANYQTALRNVKYKNLLDNPTYVIDGEGGRKTDRVVNSTPRTVSFTVNDGDDYSNILTRDINITPTNDIPVVIINLGAVLDEGESIIIPKSMLRSVDPDASSYVLYTILTPTVNGVLRIDGTVLNAGSTFTQYDINDSKLSYTHDGSETTYDSFEFNVTDYAGIASPNEIFEFQINPVYAQIIPPSNISCSHNTDGYIVLTWNDNSDNELGFYLSRQTNTSAKLNITNEYELIAALPADTEEYIDENIEEGASYTYRITAFNDEGESEIAAGDNGGETVTSAPLATPTNLHGRDNGDLTIVIEWEDNSTLETGYKIERTTTDTWGEIFTTNENTITYTDANIEEGITYLYRVKAFNAENESVYSNECSAACTMTAIEEFENGIPTEYVLYQNYPNPFNPSTTISYGLPEGGHVRLAVYNLLGQEVAVLVDQNQSAGNHTITFQTDNFSAGSKSINSGIYFYKFEAGVFTEIKKMLLLK